MAREAGVAAMVEYFDQDLPRRYDLSDDEWISLPQSDKFAMLSLSEKQAVLEQAQLCRKDFVYAARNYFWLINNESREQLFTLWESQYLVLDTMQKIREQGKTPKIMVIKARRLGCSLLIEALIAWRTIFFRNVNCIVVSVDEDSAKDLFGMMKHIYDKLPWWLQPEVASREEKSSLVFDRKDPGMRSLRPGNQSQVMVQYSTQFSGVGQGRRISGAHISEISDMMERRAQEIVEEDLTPAIHDHPDNFAFIESTGKGTNNYTHHLWRACERLGMRARWYPLFLPSFFEHSRTISVPKVWRPQRQESAMRDRVKKEWVRCDDAQCRLYQRSMMHGESLIGLICPMCQKGTLNPVTLDNGQLAWMEDRRINAEATSPEAVKKLRQEFALTSEDSFQLSGYSVFDDKCYEMVDACIEDPPKIGFIGKYDGQFHGHYPNPTEDPDARKCWCEGCNDDHRGLSAEDEKMSIWRDPVPGAEYSVGVDVAEGIGQDYSVIFVNRNNNLRAPDEQVAVWRCNQTDPKELAIYANAIGRMYNDALMAVEYNLYATTGDDMFYFHQYPNLYRWKSKDSAIHPTTTKMHWWTKAGHKTELYQNGRYWLRNGSWLIRSRNFREEMTKFQKEEYEDRNASAGRGDHDDELMAGLIAVYCPHDMDTDPNTGRIPLPGMSRDDRPRDFIMKCQNCGCEVESSGPEDFYRCPAGEPGVEYVRKPDYDIPEGESCQSIRLQWRRKFQDPNPNQRVSVNFTMLDGKTEKETQNEPSWDTL